MIFCYSCVSRKSFSNNIAAWEIGAFKNNEICGAFLLGEIGTKDNQTQSLNGSTVFFTLAERAEHIEPDLSVFDSIDSLLEANNDFIERITNIGEKLQTIPKSFVEHEEMLKDRFAREDEDFFESIPQFLKNQAENTKQQICLISIEDYEDHLLYLGEREFKKLAKDNRKDILSFLKKQYPLYQFNFYRYDVAHFFFTIEERVGDSTFIGIIRALQTYCGTQTFLPENTTYYNDFTFTLNGLAIQQLLDETKSPNLKLEQRRFNQCDKANFDLNNLHEEFQMVAALEEIIAKNSIIPYFQGIYDNKKNCFQMYEALMRLQHPDGRMLFPGDFMDISKKYGLYLDLSLGMVTKVFELFKDRHEIITLNICARDILSEKFRETVFDYIRNLPNPQNFVFELLETEIFEDLEVLRTFIHQVKQYGCKIAVDDFGSGYSNFIEFGNLDVDFLKINGSLTKLLGTDFNYNHILNSIAFMGEKMKVKLIAEYVETASTQKLLIQSGVHYSQGYFFSKPMPFSELKVISKESNATDIESNEEISEENKNIIKSSAKNESILLYLGGIFVAILTVFSVVAFVNYNQTEFKKINDSFLVEIATGLSDKIELFIEESKISLSLMSVAMADEDTSNMRLYNQELFDLNKITKFNSTYVSYDGKPAINGIGGSINIPMEKIYGKVSDKEINMLPILTDNYGNKVLVFSTSLHQNEEKIGEIYGTYRLSDISKLLALKSFGGEAFYHISQVDGTPIYLSGRQENAFKSGDMYDFIGSLQILNNLTPASIKKDMLAGNTVLLHYLLGGEERSAVMIRIPNTDWCIVSIVRAEINSEMLQSSQRGTISFIVFTSVVYALYFALVTIIFRRHRNVILKTLEASQALSSSLQLSIEKDSLTGTFSRATAIEKISDIIANQNQEGLIHSLAILDIDNFKYINDTYGHHTGDIYLQSFVSAVKLGIKPGSILGRLGGDEFLLLLSNVENRDEVIKSFDKIFNNIRKIVLGGVDLNCVSVSAGIVMITENVKTYEELMIEADNTLYSAKRMGKNKYIFSDELKT